MFVFGDLHVHQKDWLTYSGETDRADEPCYNFSTWNYTTLIPDCYSHIPALLDLFLSSDATLCSTMAFPPFRNSNHVVASISRLSIKLTMGWLFHHMAYDYSHIDCDSLCEHLRDVPWEDIFKLSASATSEFCEWVQVGTDVYIIHWKNKVKPDSSLQFLAASAADIVQTNACTNRTNLLNLK